MGDAPRTGIGKRDGLERHAGVPGLGAGRAVADDGRGVQNREDAAGGGRPEHALVEERAQLAQRPEHFDPQHQDHEQRRQRHRAGGDAPGAEGERQRGADRDPGVGDTARQRVAAEHPHRAREQGVGALAELAGARAALAERLERRQALHGVKEVGAERRVRPAARHAGLPIVAVPERGRQHDDDRRHQQDERDGQIHERDEREDEQRGQRGHEELRQVLTEVHLELLNALDQ